MEVTVQIFPGSEVAWQIENYTFKSLMTAKSIYEIMHAEYCKIYRSTIFNNYWFGI